MEYKNILGLLSGTMALLAYWIYLKDIFAGKTKPHMFSWLIWGLLASTAYFGQVSGKAGAGEWVTGLTALGCLLIFVVAIFKGDKDIHTIDKLLLAIASLSIILLVAVKDARVSTTLAVVALVIGSFLTMKKAYYKPSEETAKTFALNSIKFIPSIFALSTYRYLTVVYPVAALITNAAIVIVIVGRRK
ncbi:MAG TPA: hypothetical protein VH234_03740 [Candidatus Saccharimonadales bacterium]|nr:hypothetical protein [Candidatus Saccharimonadales bacterium]